MRPIHLALAAALPLLFCGHAQAAIALGAVKCTEPNIAPAERVPYCKAYANDGASDGMDLTGRRYLIAEADRLAGNYDEAESILNDALKLYPRSGILLAERSVVYAQEGKYDLAVADANLALANAPDDYFLLNNRCWIRGIAGKELTAGAEDCKKALSIHDDSATRDSAAFIAFKQGDMQAALDGYNAALDKSSHQWSSLYMRGIVKLRMGDADGGNADVRRAKDHLPFVAEEFALYGVPQPVIAEK